MVQREHIRPGEKRDVTLGDLDNVRLTLEQVHQDGRRLSAETTSSYFREFAGSALRPTGSRGRAPSVLRMGDVDLSSMSVHNSGNSVSLNGLPRPQRLSVGGSAGNPREVSAITGTGSPSVATHANAPTPNAPTPTRRVTRRRIAHCVGSVIHP